jgi:hypothetical protein
MVDTEKRGGNIPHFSPEPQRACPLSRGQRQVIAAGLPASGWSLIRLPDIAHCRHLSVAIRMKRPTDRSTINPAATRYGGASAAAFHRLPY